MSLITYYARLSPEEYEAVNARHDGLERLSNGTLPSGAVLRLGSPAGVLSWLLSPLRRHEQAHAAAILGASDLSAFKPPDLGPEPPVDDMLVAIEGRSPTDDVPEADLEVAYVLAAEQVARCAQLLAAIDEAQLRKELDRLDFKTIEETVLPFAPWPENEQTDVTEPVLSALRELRRFYADAARAGQMVLVWCG